MENSLSPAFVRIDYTSAWGPHSMTIPSVDVEPTTIGGSIYQFILRGAALPAQVDSAVEDFVDVIKTFFEPTTTFVSYTLFTQAGVDATPVPVEAGNLNVVGTGGATTWDKAVQWTITWRTDAFGIFKLVFLDSLSNNDFNPIRTVVGDAALVALDDYITADVTWVAGRDGGRPNTFLQVAKTLNEKLRRAYRMN